MFINLTTKLRLVLFSQLDSRQINLPYILLDFYQINA